MNGETKASALNWSTFNSIRNGTPLPKSHGRIGDIDELQAAFKEACDGFNIDNLNFMSVVDMHFDLAPAIVEADTEE